ncbi:MAG: hypothetical protein DYG91_13755, partial [Chloroflexi bacterium CFX7]|nr:hypothetical protein [Chloroflexi bacterium CFX7]
MTSEPTFVARLGVHGTVVGVCVGGGGGTVAVAVAVFAGEGLAVAVVTVGVTGGGLMVPLAPAVAVFCGVAVDFVLLPVATGDFVPGVAVAAGDGEATTAVGLSAPAGGPPPSPPVIAIGL